jgi:hypothetical protein
VVIFGAYASEAEPSADYVDNLVRILDGVRDSILSQGEFDRASFDTNLGAIRVSGKRPDAALWYAVSFTEGRRPDTTLSHPI